MSRMIALFEPCPLCAPEPDVPGPGCDCCYGTGYVPHGQAQACEDHPALDVIHSALHDTGQVPGYLWIDDVSRQGECVEFVDKTTGRRFEVVVREIDRDGEEG